MSGLRDMSVIEEAPTNRQPVQTYVLEHDDAVINEAIRRELRRGGQVFYLHNNVETISSCAAKIQEAVPEAKIAIGHGKMKEGELSEVWRQMLEQEIDVLVCTTIIETGVDLPNANTLIIENADCMGLSQLHQLRGRVGRSSRRAYAYFTFRRNKVLTEIQQKRLAAIREFTEFGSGFRIAMRDLELRGAGNIMGAQQHGHMESVGYYALYNFKGKKLTKTYQNAFDEVGQNIYSHWINDKEYEYFRCDADGTNKVLFRVKCPNGRPGALPTDGTGVYALRTDEHTVTCFDRFGTTLGTIKQDGEITMEPTFENGCVRVMDKLYLPTGEEI